MPIAYIRPLGESGLYHIHVVDQVDPGFGGGRPGGVDPGYGQGAGMRPDQGLPGSGGRPDNSLPGGGAHPGNRPPGSGGGGIPDNELPDTPPPTVAPGATLVLIRGPQGKWVYAAIDPGQPPPRPLPPSSGRPDNTLPGQGGQPPRPDNTVPGQPVVGGGPAPPQPGGQPGHPSGQPVPPPGTAQPKK